ncbi:MAG: Nre family DNA repair protein [Methanosarcinaceae archaeon]
MKQNLCVKCKGKGLCGRPMCPILKRFRTIELISSNINSNINSNVNSNVKSKSGDSIFGASPPSVFVGRYGYPSISAGPMIPPYVSGNDAMALEDPQEWLKMEIGDIITSRSQLVRANTKVKVTDANSHDNPLLLKSQELALSKKPVDTEAWFSKPIKSELKFDGVLAPIGPSGTLKNFEIAENPKVPKKVDYLVYDTDALAKDVVLELHNGNVQNEHITRLLSIGLLGKVRRLVPTRWSITAVDDMTGKNYLHAIRDYRQIGDITLFNGESFGNHFEILFVPRSFSYELIESWLPRTVWSGNAAWIGSDHEGIGGKKRYSSLAGGYYAARLGALEYLGRIRRQASVFMVREIRPDYWAPLGVWVVREAARQALKNTPQKFDSIELALADMSGRLRTPYADWMEKAEMLSNIRCQRTLDSFF